MTEAPLSIAKRLRYRIEYVGFRFGLFLLDHLPFAVAKGVGAFFADLVFVFGRRRRRIACGNIVRSGIATEPNQVRRIARASFKHLVTVAIEALRFGKILTADTWRERVELDITPDARFLLETDGEALIMVTAHVGNWEIGGRLMSYMSPVTAIARPMNNPYVERIMGERNAGSRVTLIPKRGAGARAMLRPLRRGEALGLLVDQHASGGGIMLDFFGVPASTYPTPAYLHLRTGVPIIFGYCLRTGPMQFRLAGRTLPPLERSGDREADVRAIMTQLNQALEALIRENPEQYLWAHRRWRDATS